MTTQDEFGLVFRPAMTARERIDRAWRLFHSVIPADSAARGRERTPYFYRTQAVAWARMAREFRWDLQMCPTFISLAKSYLVEFRKRAGGAR